MLILRVLGVSSKNTKFCSWPTQDAEILSCERLGSENKKKSLW